MAGERRAGVGACQWHASTDLTESKTRGAPYEVERATDGRPYEVREEAGE